MDRINFQGLPALQLDDDAVRLTVIPGWGGKVVEIFDRRRGREWLFENPAFSHERCAACLPAYGADYMGQFDLGGFDECFPTVGQCFYLGLEPCIGAPDTLDTAVHHWSEYGELPAKGSQTWWFHINLS